MLQSKHLIWNGVAYILAPEVYLGGYNAYTMHCYPRHYLIFFFSSKQLSGEEHLKMLSEKDDETGRRI